MKISNCLFIIGCATIGARPLTLTDFQKHAAALDEIPQQKIDDWRDPDYSDYQRSKNQSSLRRWATWLGVMHDTWNPDDLKEALITMRAEQERLRMVEDAVMIARMPEHTQLVVWGDVQGSYHSLVRALTYLHSVGKISENLEIIDPEYALVFLGDAISRSAYIMETLTLVATLVVRNPGKALYLRGVQEDKGHWKNFGLPREIIVRTPAWQPAQRTELSELVDAVMRNLPHALYVRTVEGADVVCLSNSGRSTFVLSAEQLGALFAGVLVGETRARVPEEYEGTPESLAVRAIIRGEVPGETLRPTSGLDDGESEGGATTWVVTSSPNITYQTQHQFFYDAFCVITLGKTVEQSTITLYNRDLRTQEPFEPREQYELVSGRTLLVGTGISTLPKDRQEINIGTSLPLAGAHYFMGQRVRRGLSICVNNLNKRGGIKGHSIDLFVYNNRSRERLARKTFEKLASEKIDVIIAPTGKEACDVYKEKIAEGDMGIFFPCYGAEMLYTAAAPNVVTMRASFEDELKALVDYAHKEMDLRSFVLIFTDDDFGASMKEMATRIFARYPDSSWTPVVYAPHMRSLKENVDALLAIHPDPEAIVLACSASAAQQLIRISPPHFLLGKFFLGLSFLSETPFRNFVKSFGVRMLFSHVVPDPTTSHIQVVREYRAAMDKERFAYDTQSLEGYIAAELLMYGLQHVPQLPTDHATLMKVFEGARAVQYKGLPLTFDSARRSFASAVWIEKPTGGEWIMVPISSDVLKLEESPAYALPDQEIIWSQPLQKP